MDDAQRLDLTSDPKSKDASNGGDASNRADGSGQARDGRAPRPFLGIRFQCCRTYGRIYRNESATAYEGRCPKCQARISVPIGTGGSASRFFNAN